MSDYKADPNDNTKQIPNTTYSQNEGFPQHMTTTARDALSSPATGTFIYNTTTNKIN
jgi:hypothetical protein